MIYKYYVSGKMKMLSGIKNTDQKLSNIIVISEFPLKYKDCIEIVNIDKVIK